MRRSVGISMLSGMLLSFGGAQQPQVGQWQNYTDMKSVRSVAIYSNAIAAATAGGLFTYDETQARYARWTNSENLSSNDLTALMIDSNNRFWIGSSNGAIDIFDPSSNSRQAIVEIKNSNQVQKAIRGFFETGDSIFVTSDFGVSVFVTSRGGFADTYANFGFAAQPTVKEVLVYKGQVFVGTDQGLAVAALSSPNLQAPTSWTTYGIAQGLPSSGIKSVATLNDTVVVGTATGNFYLAGSTFIQVPSSAGRSVVKIVSSSSGLFFVWNGAGRFTVESSNAVNAATTVIAFKDTYQATSLAIGQGSSSVSVGTTTGGIARWDGSQWIFLMPNSPRSNQFINLAVEPGGVLWAASGIDGHGTGFYRFNPALTDGNQWKNFSQAVNPLLTTDDYYKVSIGLNGSVWVSSWGDGVVEVVSDTIRRKLNSSSTPALASSVPQNLSFVVAGGVATDAQGMSWFVNRTAVNGNFLAVLVNDTAFQFVRNQFNPSDGFFASITIDQYGTKWLTNSEPTKKSSNGLYYFNADRLVSGTDFAGGWGNMSTADGLPNSTVLSLAVDLENTLWVGTDLGVTIVPDPRNPKTSRFSSFPLREQSIQTIAVDALNNKWVGTKEGVFVVNSDGTQLLNQYTMLNTNGKLVSDDVRSIAIDQNRGVVYIGTENGLSSLQIAAVQSLRSFATLEFGPNPYILPNPQPLSIMNLVSNSTIKILTVSGTVVSQFSAQGGGRAFWDGRDRLGNYVSTGVYFVIAFADNGTEVASGKIAVVRK
jgi:ligand-binding sensor domain-containing protein